MAYVASIATARLTAVMVLAGAIAGCAQAERGETVFVDQNKAAAALGTMLMEAEMQDPKQADRLYGVETTLAEACAPLRQAAQRKMADEEVGIELELMIFNSLDRCAAETKRVEQMVWETNPEVGRFYLTSASAGTQAGK
jgi:hypothetical protein